MKTEIGGGTVRGSLANTLPLSLCLAAFVVTFVSTRIVTRLIRSGRGPFKDNVTEGGVHVHHAVPGLVLLLVGAVTALGASTLAFRCLAGLAVGAGASLILDEFALILHLEDVYWARQGRASVQAIALFAVCLLLVVLGFSPVSTQDFTSGPGLLVWTLAVWATFIFAAVICVRKGKYRLVLLSIFLFFPAYVGAIRLARPDSPWFARHYPPGSAKRARATRRASTFDVRWSRRWVQVADLIAGAPTADEVTPMSGAAPRAAPALGAGSAEQAGELLVESGEGLGHAPRIVEHDPGSAEAED